MAEKILIGYGFDESYEKLFEVLEIGYSISTVICANPQKFASFIDEQTTNSERHRGNLIPSIIGIIVNAEFGARELTMLQSKIPHLIVRPHNDQDYLEVDPTANDLSPIGFFIQAQLAKAEQRSQQE